MAYVSSLVGVRFSTIFFGALTVNRQRQEVKSYVLRQGRMTRGQARALDLGWPAYGLNSAMGTLDFEITFGRSAPTVLEIGFGMGDSLVTQAKLSPEKNFIGVEVHKPGVGHLLMQVIEKEIKISGEVERYVHVHGVRLKRGEDESGALIVLNDISRLKQLERIRRDFVANVSHELKTPITSIQGYVETLKETLPETAEEQSQRFLSIIVRQTERMNLIIDDLLHLARIEDLEERDKLEKITTEIRPILDSSIEDVRVRNRVEEIRFKLRCPDDLTAKVNSQLIRQAVTNLLDNAVNYGDESTIIIEGALVQDMIELRVKNSGQPISMEHQERLFERFYRIDKGLSLIHI